MSKYVKWAKLSIGESDWRISVMGNSDIPECVDILQEEFREGKWQTRATIECLSQEILRWLSDHAKIVVEIEDGQEQ